jgi:hypothetical protein
MWPLARRISWLGRMFLSAEGARLRSLRLLNESLSDAQREQFARFCYFDVIGGDSGKRYRIHVRPSVNVEEIEGGKPVVNLCFIPNDALPAGDVLLAQKVALEAFEEECLAIAHRYKVNQ